MLITLDQGQFPIDQLRHEKKHYYIAVILNISSTNAINSKWCYLQTKVASLWSDHWYQEDTVSIAEILDQAIVLYNSLAELFSS